MTTQQVSPEASEAPRSSNATPRPKGITLPERPLAHCARCLVARGTKTKGWTPVLWDGQTVGWTCPECPRPNEPIRRVETSKGEVRFRYTVTVTPKGSRKAVQKTGTTTTLDEARARVESIREEIRATGTYSVPTRLTVEVLAQRWLAMKEREVAAGNLRPSTLNSSYRSALTSICARIGHREAAEVTTAEVRDLLNDMKTKRGKRNQPLSQASLRMALLGLRMIFSWGVEQRWLSHNPVIGVRAPKALPRTTEERSKWWTTKEYEAFRAHVDSSHATGTVNASRNPWVRVGMRLTLCGLRRSEVLGLDWSSVDQQAGTVAVVASRGKTGRGNGTSLGGPKSRESRRVVHVEAILPGTKAALLELRLAQGQPESGLVVLDNLGQPVQPDAYSRRFRALCGAAGVPALGSIHNLRHTIATAMHEAGHAPVMAASLLGHSVPTHLAFYVPTTDEHAAAAATEVGAIFGARTAATS